MVGHGQPLLLKVRTMNVNLKDGTYQITTARFCAGFVVKGRKVIRYAPILFGQLAHWKPVGQIEKRAVWVGD